MDHVARLARRNSALEDFASLVAHELKTPLQLALLSEDPSGDVERALDLVDAILEVACSESANESQTNQAGTACASPLGKGLKVSAMRNAPMPKANEPTNSQV